jgi:hypothetical protein
MACAVEIVAQLWATAQECCFESAHEPEMPMDSDVMRLRAKPRRWEQRLH